jgi:hypothetical protein
MVQLERVGEPGYLEEIRVLLLTYEGQKPPREEIHQGIAAWVRQGGALILFGLGDAYDRVREWWNQEGRDYDRPQEHLSELLDLGRTPGAGLFPCGRGWVIVEPASPAGLAHEKEGAEKVMARVRQAHQALGVGWREGNALVLRRGPYVVAAGMDESTSAEPVVLEGTYVNLYDLHLAVCRDPAIAPDTRWLLYDLERCPDHPWVIAAAGRVREERYDDNSLSFTVEGMAGTRGAARVRLPAGPEKGVVCEGEVEWDWEAVSQTALVWFDNRPEGVPVEIRW